MGQEENKNSRDNEWKMVEFMTKVEIIGKGEKEELILKIWLIKSMTDWSSTKNRK